MDDPDVTTAKRVEAVRSFDDAYGAMDRTLWTLSQACRPSLLRGEHSQILDELVWTVKSWWGVQGVRSETKRRMGAALASLDWAPEFFEETSLPAGDAETFASDVVQSLVSRSMKLGVERREYSLASKVLHWLMPWRVPVFDSFVRSMAGVPDTWDFPDAYKGVVDFVFANVREMADEDTTWVGASDPKSLLHALDKWLWWAGGGSQGTAAVVTDPTKVLRRLGLNT